ncbi:MAG TPA: hypothetical protein VIJ27_01380 [Mucilaginibacter sp.]
MARSVKNIFLLFIVCFYISKCCAQDIVGQKNKLTNAVIERFYVLKMHPDIKQGPYKAYFRRKTLIASGNYNNGKKTGIWSFGDISGKLVENYNYNTNNYIFEGPLDTNTYLGFLFDTLFVKTDIVTRPLKIGGSYYGFIPYMNLFQLPFETFDVNTDYFLAYIELLISPMGRLANYNVRIIAPYYEYDHSFNLDINLLSEADRTFQPATLNGRPILSRIVIKCYVTSSGELDFY